ncbi:MAG: glycosyltransferase family 4 protein [Candidatus Sifarchaeia archaeon]
MKPKTAVHLSWEFPPRKVGGLAAHVYDLSKALSNLGHKIYVITADFPGTKETEVVGRVNVHRYDSYSYPGPDFITWAILMQQTMQEKAAELINVLHASGQQVDLIHAHDWLTGLAAIELKHGFRLPLVTTVHSTELGRRNGLHDDGQQMIHAIEKRLSFESWRIIACSKYMADQIKYAYAISGNKIDVIPNGVYTTKFKSVNGQSTVDSSFRRKFATDPEKIVLYVGRMVPEKGVNVLVGSIPQVIASMPNAKFIFVGDGYYRAQYMRIAYGLGVAHKCYFTGFLEDDRDVQKLFTLADVCVFPSLYEPFGIVALEAMAAGTPVIVSDIGGLSEIIDHGHTGLKVPVNNSNALARAIISLLSDSGLASSLRKNALETVQKLYHWQRIAKQTTQVYQRVVREYQKNPWKPKAFDSPKTQLSG